MGQKCGQVSSVHKLFRKEPAAQNGDGTFKSAEKTLDKCQFLCVQPMMKFIAENGFMYKKLFHSDIYIINA